MAKLQMKKVYLYGLKKYRKKILRKVQQLGTIEVADSSYFARGLAVENKKDVKTFSVQKEEIKKAIKLLKDGAEVVKGAIGLISKFLPKSKDKTLDVESPFYEPINITEEEFNLKVEKAEDVVKLSYDVENCSKKIAKNNGDILTLKQEYEFISQWKKLDVPMSITGTNKTSCFIGTLPSSTDYESEKDILKKFPKTLNGANDFLHIEIVKKSKDQVFVFVLCKKTDEDSILNVLLNLGFVACKYDSDSVPSDLLKEIVLKIKNLETENKNLENKIKTKEKYLPILKFVYDYYMSKCENYEVISKLYNTNKVFVLSGYLPKKDINRVKSVLNRLENVFFEIEEINETEDEPVLLKNPKVCAAVEPVLESYSLPSKLESDPTSVMSVFYYFLFGLMLSDAGYGAVITAFCSVLLLKFKNIRESFKKSLIMFLICGISTMFWGLMFGSFFGDAIEVVSSTFLGHEIKTPTFWFVPIKNPMFMLSFSFGVGIVHMFTGLFLKFINLIKLKKFKDAICDVLSWFLLVFGLIIYLLSVPIVPKLLNINLHINGAVANVSKYFMLLGALVILLTYGRGTKNIFKRFLKGLYGLYGITGYLSDIISYSRLLALGLSTGVIAQVFNKMGAMGGKSFFGVILFVLVFLIGHTVNILINLLGAYVHTNRLQFVEFFSKFYEGGGRKFSPFNFKTRYCKFFGGTV